MPMVSVLWTLGLTGDQDWIRLGSLPQLRKDCKCDLGLDLSKLAEMGSLFSIDCLVKGKSLVDELRGSVVFRNDCMSKCWSLPPLKDKLKNPDLAVIVLFVPNVFMIFLMLFGMSVCNREDVLHVIQCCRQCLDVICSFRCDFFVNLVLDGCKMQSFIRCWAENAGLLQT